MPFVLTMRGVVTGGRAQLPWKGGKQALFLPLVGMEQTAAHWFRHPTDHTQKGQQSTGFPQQLLEHSTSLKEFLIQNRTSKAKEN